MLKTKSVMEDKERVVSQTKKWINDVIIGCNFCPFAAKVVKQQTVYYQVENSSTPKICLDVFLNEIIFGYEITKCVYR